MRRNWSLNDFSNVHFRSWIWVTAWNNGNQIAISNASRTECNAHSTHQVRHTAFASITTSWTRHWMSVSLAWIGIEPQCRPKCALQWNVNCKTRKALSSSFCYRRHKQTDQFDLSVSFTLWPTSLFHRKHCKISTLILTTCKILLFYVVHRRYHRYLIIHSYILFIDHSRKFLFVLFLLCDVFYRILF